MSGPTWPPTPEQADAETIEEYGDLARAVIAGAQSDEEAEDTLLAHFLYAPPPQEIDGAEDAGTFLDEVVGHVHPWLTMVSGLNFGIAYGDPAGTDGDDLYLPRLLQGPPDPVNDERFYRCTALLQLGLIRFGLLRQRGILAELHSDWVLRGAWQVLAARYLMRRWSEAWAGIAKDFEQLQHCPRATQMRVGHQVVPGRGMPETFRPLYVGLVAATEQAGPEGEPAREATSAVDSIEHESAAPLVLMGQAQRLRQLFFERRLGPPPLPAFVGLVRPAWVMEDIAADMQAANEWREGPKPLRPLLDAMRRRTERGGVTSKLKGRLMGASTAPAVQTAFLDDYRPLHKKNDGWRYDEWDAARGVMRLEATRIVDVDATTGPLSTYTRLVESYAGECAQIRRAFSALRLEERWLHAQPEGTDIDLDRCISAMADIRAGYSPKPDWFVKFSRASRPLSVLTLVDVSGSTQGNVIRQERTSLVLLSEGLEALQCPHALYGFSGEGPDLCKVQRIKAFSDVMDDDVRKRMVHLQAGGSTRLGAYVRHATHLLSRRPEDRRVLLLLSDGRPEDGDDYRGSSGVQDSALAVRAAIRSGLFVFCVSLDGREGASTYLQEIFGKGRFLIVERPEQLPTRLPEVLRDLVR